MSPSGVRRAKLIARRAPRQVPAAFSVSKPRRCARNAEKKQPFRSSRHKDARYIAANVSSSGDRPGHRASRRRKKRIFVSGGLKSAERSSRQFEFRCLCEIGGRGASPEIRENLIHRLFLACKRWEEPFDFAAIAMLLSRAVCASTVAIRYSLCGGARRIGGQDFAEGGEESFGFGLRADGYAQEIG
jgi:hypothetical protein